jgi:site-specific DNA-methyltransferase (adenine-specific)
MWNGMLQGSIGNGRIMEGNKKLNEKRIHPTQKPVHLYKWLLTKFAEKGSRILDTHLGSGSSAIASHYFGCDFVGCEIDQEYFAAGKKRFEEETRQIAFDLARG